MYMSLYPVASGIQLELLISDPMLSKLTISGHNDNGGRLGDILTSMILNAVTLILPWMKSRKYLFFREKMSFENFNSFLGFSEIITDIKNPPYLIWASVFIGFRKIHLDYVRGS